MNPADTLCPECGLSGGSHFLQCSQAGEMYWPNQKEKSMRHDIGLGPANVPTSANTAILPNDAKARKGIPITTGCFDYFPRALAYIAQISVAGNNQHNPGKPLHWDKTKSTDHADCAGRHLLERGTRDADKLRHSGKLGWRSLAILEEELEAAEKAGQPW